MTQSDCKLRGLVEMSIIKVLSGQTYWAPKFRPTIRYHPHASISNCGVPVVVRIITVRNTITL